MTDEQFKDFITKFDKVLDQKFAAFEESIIEDFEPRFQKIETQLDYLVGAVDTDESERLALGSQMDRKFDDHERRITKLELATS